MYVCMFNVNPYDYKHVFFLRFLPRVENPWIARSKPKVRQSGQEAEAGLAGKGKGRFENLELSWMINKNVKEVPQFSSLF